jgi:hydroxypyruvate reductase
LIHGGETTVTVQGTGRGGRNQELVLSAACSLAGAENIVICSFATDGVDGMSNAAGAIATGDTLERAQALGFQAEQCLAENDSACFFAALADAIVTGPTGTNVNDIAIALVYAGGSEK